MCFQVGSVGGDMRRGRMCYYTYIGYSSSRLYLIRWDTLSTNSSLVSKISLGAFTFIYCIGCVFLSRYTRNIREVEILEIYNLWLWGGMGILSVLTIMGSIIWYRNTTSPGKFFLYSSTTSTIILTFAFMFISGLPDTYEISLTFQGEEISPFEDPPSGTYYSSERYSIFSVAIKFYMYSLLGIVLLSVLGAARIVCKYRRKEGNVIG